MAEEQETGDSTALLEPSQENATEATNVVTEEVSSHEDTGGNMSLAELTTQLLAKGEEQKEGEEPEAEEAVSEEAPDKKEESPEDEQPKAADTDDGNADKKVLLDRYGLNLDSMSEDEAMSLGRALRTESLKRFGRLTAQKREAEAELQNLKAKASENGESAAPVERQDDPMSEVWTMDTLAKKEKDLQNIEDWAEDSLTSEAQYDEDGEEFSVETEGRKYTKQELLGLRNNTRKMLRKNGALDKRYQFLTHRQKFDGEAMQYFPWMSDDKSAEFVEYQNFVSQDKYKKLLDTIPEANVFAGLVVEGNLRVRERMKTSTNGGAGVLPREKPIMPATESSAAPKRVQQGDRSRIQKAVGSAKQQFEKTGSIQSLARLRELQAQMS